MQPRTGARRGTEDGAAVNYQEDRPAPEPQIFADLFVSACDRSLPWQPFRQGIEICRLYEQPGGASAAFLRYAPGAQLQRHQHSGYEHIFVLSGSQTDDHGEHCVGAMLIHPPGSSHTVSTTLGCVVLAVWEKPVLFLPDEE
jgi:anti-sigma factor ChrR (cupin superfamily)